MAADEGQTYVVTVEFLVPGCDSRDEAEFVVDGFLHDTEEAQLLVSIADAYSVDSRLSRQALNG